MELEEYKFDHFKNIDEVMYYLNYWYNEEDAYSINRYLSLKDFNYISNKYQELKKQLEEINKLNNVINELEKWLNNQTMISLKYEIGYYKEVLDKLKELKENKYENNTL